MKSLRVLFLLAVLCVAVPTFAQQTATQSFTLTVTAPALSITTNSPLPSGTSGSAYTTTIVAAGGQPSYQYGVSVGTLPTGLALSISTGVISGTPTVTGTSNFTIRVTDSQSPSVVVTKAFALTINASLTISTTTIPAAALATPYTATVTFSGGVAPYTCSVSVGALPTGLTVSTVGSTCVISGTPTQAGSFAFTLKVTDSSPLGASIQVQGKSLIARVFSSTLYSRN